MSVFTCTLNNQPIEIGAQFSPPKKKQEGSKTTYIKTRFICPRKNFDSLSVSVQIFNWRLSFTAKRVGNQNTRFKLITNKIVQCRPHVYHKYYHYESVSCTAVVKLEKGEQVANIANFDFFSTFVKNLKIFKKIFYFWQTGNYLFTPYKRTRSVCSKWIWRCWKFKPRISPNNFYWCTVKTTTLINNNK